jgi:hypothetical protein
MSCKLMHNLGIDFSVSSNGDDNWYYMRKYIKEPDRKTGIYKLQWQEKEQENNKTYDPDVIHAFSTVFVMTIHHR